MAASFCEDAHLLQGDEELIGIERDIEAEKMRVILSENLFPKSSRSQAEGKVSISTRQ